MRTKKRVLGLTHVDFGFLKGRLEMEQVFDEYLIRLFDILERYPDFHYLLEQALHYRELKMRRPDLFEKLQYYIKKGNLEFATPLASTIDNNLTNGESFVRNMQLGARWLEKELEVHAATCMMIDTFGFPPQMPQVLKQFGYSQMFANRLGGEKLFDVFQCTGLDGSELLVCGSDVQTDFKKNSKILFQYYKQRSDLEALLERSAHADSAHLLIMPYSENEVAPDPYFIDYVQRNSDEYQYTTFSDFMKELSDWEGDWPRESADLNPEFSGAFSLRHLLKQHNRKTEYLLLEAEKLLVLTGKYELVQPLEEYWWEMAYLQFHDILTGSHPSIAYLDCLDRFDRIEKGARKMIETTIKGVRGNPALDKTKSFTIYNGLPWTRNERIEIALADDWAGVRAVLQKGKELDFCFREGKVIFNVEIPPMSSTAVEIEHAQADDTSSAKPLTKLENKTLLVEFGTDYMIQRIYHKPSGTILIENCNDILILQRDLGSFQTEQPLDVEIPCAAGTYSIALSQEFGCQRANICGKFPPIDNREGVGYRICMTLPENKPYLDLEIEVDWQQEASRLRLNLPTTLGATENYYEVPFGVAKRAPYSTTRTAKGEWASHRFAAMDNEATNRGVALANTGCAGVETANGTLKTTLLRAPHITLAGLNPDDTSSDHGTHVFHFRMLGYQGSWRQSGMLRYAQELNAPCLIVPDTQTAVTALFTLESENIVLSSVRYADSGLTVIRLYESTGVKTEIQLQISNLQQVWESDLREKPIREIAFADQVIPLTFLPFEIKTLLVKRTLQ